MTARTDSAGKRQPLTGRRVFYMLLGFFGFITAVNAVFIYFAFDTWPGLGTEDAYRKGLAYNETLDAARNQNELGWFSEVAFSPRGPEAGELRVRLRDDRRRALSGLSVSIHLARPVDARYDQTVVLSAAGDGLYRAPVTLPLKGRWQATVEARENGQERYKMMHELMVK